MVGNFPQYVFMGKLYFPPYDFMAKNFYLKQIIYIFTVVLGLIQPRKKGTRKWSRCLFKAAAKEVKTIVPQQGTGQNWNTLEWAPRNSDKELITLSCWVYICVDIY